MSEKFKWATPHEWLLDALETRDVNIAAVVSLLDADDIQNAFQAGMDDDGYFDPICNKEAPE